jgi:hypothetical protein
MIMDCMFGFLIACCVRKAPFKLIPPSTHTHTKQAAYIPIPQSTSTVDLSTGAITHTIIIMPETAKPAAVLRVRPSEELTTAPLFRYVYHGMLNGMQMTGMLNSVLTCT